MLSVAFGEASGTPVKCGRPPPNLCKVHLQGLRPMKRSFHAFYELSSILQTSVLARTFNSNLKLRNLGLASIPLCFAWFTASRAYEAASGIPCASCDGPKACMERSKDSNELLKARVVGRMPVPQVALSRSSLLLFALFRLLKLSEEGGPSASAWSVSSRTARH